MTPGPVVQVAFGPKLSLLTWLDPQGQIHLWQDRSFEFGDCGRIDPAAKAIYITNDYLMMVHGGGVECHDFYNVRDPKPYCESFDGDGFYNRVWPPAVPVEPRTERRAYASIAAPAGAKPGRSSCLAADRSPDIPTVFSSADWQCELKGSNFTCAETGQSGTAGKQPFKPGGERRVKAVVEGPGFQCLAVDEHLQCHTRIWEHAFDVELEWSVDAQFGFGDGFACVLRTTSGEVECSGDTSVGQRGDGTLGSSFEDPGAERVDVPPSRLLAVASDHACVVTLDGALWCWGTNPVPEFGIHVY